MERQMRLWLEALTRCVLFVLVLVCLAFIRTFPDLWTDGLPKTHRFRALGNAVTVKVVEYILNNSDFSGVGSSSSSSSSSSDSSSSSKQLVEPPASDDLQPRFMVLDGDGWGCRAIKKAGGKKRKKGEQIKTTTSGSASGGSKKKPKTNPNRISL